MIARILYGVLLVFALLVFGDFAWLYLCATFPIYVVGRTTRTGPRLLAVFASVVVIGFHLIGFKIWGNEMMLLDIWKPLDHPRELHAIVPPGNVVLAGGDSHQLYGVIVTQGFTTIYPTSTNVEQWAVYDAQQQVRRRVFRGGKILVEPRGVGTNGNYRFGYQRRRMFGCGNSYFPRPFVIACSRYADEDLGAWLVSYGLAIPDESVMLSDPAYGEILAKSSEICRRLQAR